MDISFSDEHEAFRGEVRAFLDAALSEDLKEAQRLCPGIFLDYEHNIRWHRILYRQGWVAPSWPQRHGGAGWDLMRRYIWSLEASGAGAPSLAPMGLGMCGPMLIGHGSKAQQAELLPRILSGEDYWCQGYSEPGAGSDLSSLKTAAVQDGDDYLVNGTKIWTTHAQFADHIFCLVRTDSSGRPQHGITFLLIPMSAPGVRVAPIITLAADHEVNQVFFDDVRVPQANRVGPEHEGWNVAKYLLEFERGGGGAAARLRVSINHLKAIAEAEKDGAAPLWASSSFRARINALDIRIEALQFDEHLTLARMSRGESPGPGSSLAKNNTVEIDQAINELKLEAVGHYAMPHANLISMNGRNEPWVGPDHAETVTPRYLNSRAASVFGGAREVQKNIIAKVVLGL